MKLRIFAVVALFALSTVCGFAAAALPLVPGDAYLVVNFDFAALANQPEIKALVETQLNNQNDNYTDFYKRAGIEPARDIKNVTIFIDAQERAGIIVDGAFDTAKISELVQSDTELAGKFAISTIEGMQAVKNASNENANMMFVNKNTVAFGSEDVLKQVAALNAGKGANIAANKEFSGMMSKVDADSQFWGAVVAGPNWQTRMNVPVTGLEAMKTAFFSLDYDKEFTMVFTALIGDKAEMPKFTAAMQNLLDAFKGWVASVPEMGEILKTAQIQDNKEDMARIVVSMPAEQFKASMIKIAEKANEPKSAGETKK
ncbi:MAG TPA: hypothetical protein PLM07_03625 [Candidatus Rifleibacterium sp.]|nr:hypothetical protein [Candidatus Rifleibacterium sp.]HPT44974.1 hypothetical protein [Candidatus Rifleibacterium sp.]